MNLEGNKPGTERPTKDLSKGSGHKERGADLRLGGVDLLRYEC